jgi:hypothetical protein
MTKRILLVVALISVLCFVVMAADVTGKWTAQVPGRQGGQAREQAFNFKVDGDKLTGTMSGGQGGDIAIADGKVSGDNISFTVTRERGGNTVKLNFTGAVSGNEIKMKQEGGQGQAREFVAKRAN